MKLLRVLAGTQEVHEKRKKLRLVAKAHTAKAQLHALQVNADKDASKLKQDLMTAVAQGQTQRAEILAAQCVTRRRDADRFMKSELDMGSLQQRLSECHATTQVTQLIQGAVETLGGVLSDIETVKVSSDNLEKCFDNLAMMQTAMADTLAGPEATVSDVKQLLAEANDAVSLTMAQNMPDTIGSHATENHTQLEQRLRELRAS